MRHFVRFSNKNGVIFLEFENTVDSIERVSRSYNKKKSTKGNYIQTTLLSSFFFSFSAAILILATKAFLKFPLCIYLQRYESFIYVLFSALPKTNWTCCGAILPLRYKPHSLIKRRACKAPENNKKSFKGP